VTGWHPAKPPFHQLADGNKFGHTDQDGIERFWRHLLADAASMRFHRPDSGLGLNNKAVAAIRAARKIESKIPLWTVKPANELIVDRKPNQAYLSADPGTAWILYLPAGGDVTLNFPGTQEPRVVHWVDIATGEWGPEQDLTGSEVHLLTAPGKGNWAAAIIRQE
jgi:hypothetical protein